VGTVICPNATVCQIEPATVANVMFTTRPFANGYGEYAVAIAVDSYQQHRLAGLGSDFSTGVTVSSFTIPSSGSLRR